MPSASPARGTRARQTARSTIPVAEPDGSRRGVPAQGRELRARGKRTLRKLLDAGAEVFARRGYHAARVDDIVKVARTSHGTFYLYFANKEDLFRALATQVAEQMIDLAESLGPIGSGRAGERELRAWLERFGDLYDRYGPVVRAWTEAEIGDSDFGRLGTEVLGRLAEVLAQRIAVGGASDLDPQIAALALVAMIERFHYYVLSAQVQADREAMLDTLASVAHAGFFAKR